jgi:hypothetical protein
VPLNRQYCPGGPELLGLYSLNSWHGYPRLHLHRFVISIYIINDNWQVKVYWRLNACSMRKELRRLPHQAKCSWSKCWIPSLYICTLHNNPTEKGHSRMLE